MKILDVDLHVHLHTHAHKYIQHTQTHRTAGTIISLFSAFNGGMTLRVWTAVL